MIGQLSPYIILAIIGVYFCMLLGISHWRTKNDTGNAAFFVANRESHWALIAFGLLGASISGITFISVPGKVGMIDTPNMAFSYMQLVFGYLAGYVFIALVLMPVYYRMNLTSIYTYLENRFGFYSYKTGAAFFLLARTLGSACRMYLIAMILQKFVLEPLHVPFVITAFVVVFLIWVYTYKGGTNTVIWTDTLATICFLSAVVLTIVVISNSLERSVSDLLGMVWQSDYSKIFFFSNGWTDPNNFFKQFLTGALTTITMTGMDQDLMQRNLACKNLKDAQKNMFSFSAALVVVNLMFLTLGALLYIYANQNGLPMPKKSDELYAMIAFQYLPHVGTIIFVLGLVAAAYSSADSALTALTTSFCVDFLNFEKNAVNLNVPEGYYLSEETIAHAKEVEAAQTKLRQKVHLGFTGLLFLVILVLNWVNTDAIIDVLLKVSGYTYGPILGLFIWGLYTNRTPLDKYVPIVCILAPLLCYPLDLYSKQLFWGFNFGQLTLLPNGLLTIFGLWILSKWRENQEAKSVLNTI